MENNVDWRRLRDGDCMKKGGKKLNARKENGYDVGDDEVCACEVGMVMCVCVVLNVLRKLTRDTKKGEGEGEEEKKNDN